MNNFLTRTLTGAVFVTVMVGGILWNIYTYIALFTLLALLGLWEFYTLMEKGNPSIPLKATQKIPGVLLAVILIGASCGKYFFDTNNILHLPGIQFIMLIFPVVLIARLFSEDMHFNIFSPTLFGILFAVLPFCYLLMFYSSVSYYESENNIRIILGFFIFVWSNDTFAYLTGRTLGRTKLFERISPQKTWEGTIGGIICTQGISFLLSMYFTELAPIHWQAIALIVSVFGTLGDLVESKFKRSLGVKDSGTILPGHGGILDRFDGALLAAPFVVSYLIIIR